MDCRDCHLWNKEERRCMDGKVNPPRYETAVSVVQVLGLRSICPFNDFRERLIAARIGPDVRRLVDGTKSVDG
jgi:hypothetical protein